MRLVRLLPLLPASIVSAACGAPRSTPPAPIESAVAPSLSSSPASRTSTPSAVPEAQSSASTGVRGLEIPDLPTVACDVRTSSWSGVVSLRAGLPFARVSGVPATLTLEKPPVAHVVVEREIRLHALVESPAIHAATPTLLGGFALPFAETGLTWSPVERTGKVTVQVATDDLFAEPVKATLEVDCGDLAASEPTYDLPGFLRGLPGTEVSLAAGAGLSATPQGKLVATLRRDAGSPAVVIESKGTSRRVVVTASGYFAVGWVDAKFVGNEEYLAPAFGHGVGGAYSEYVGTPPSCDHEVPVFGQVGRERAHLGTMHAGTGYRRAPRPEGQTEGLESEWTAIALVSPWLRPVDGASLLVRAEDLTGCP